MSDHADTIRRLRDFATTPDGSGADPRHTQHKADIRALLSELDALRPIAELNLKLLDHDDKCIRYECLQRDGCPERRTLFSALNLAVNAYAISLAAGAAEAKETE